MKPRIYNRDMELVGVLQNASAISYVRKHNDLFTASFELPFDDPKNVLCDTHFIVDIFDGETSKGKYRILDELETDLTTVGQFAKYSCEHVIGFLLNDVIDGYVELGGTDVSTRTVIEDILSRQTVQRWTLGECDFDYEFQYSWENTNLLDALFSIPTCFEDAYHWTYDTDTFPWTLNLVRQSTDRSCEIRRKRNMQYIKREKDTSSGFYTRLYCKGNGEGVNQLGIKDVNGGLPYIDADTVGTYGLISGHYIDLTITDAETLLAKGRAMLEEVKHPRYTYKAKAVDLCKVTGLDWHSFDEGKCVHIIDDEKKIDIDAMIIEVSKQDVDGDPLDVDLTISNKPSDVSSAIEDLSRRAAITAQYSQGATNLYAQQFADNADEEHPATMRVYVPSECKQINKMLLSWKLAPFRAYERGASSGGGDVAIAEQHIIETNIVTLPPLTLSGDTMTLTSNTVDEGGFAISNTSEAGSHSHVMQHTHGFSGSQRLSNGHTHSVKVSALDTWATTLGVSENTQHNVSISGQTGNANVAGDIRNTTDDDGAHTHTMSHRHSFVHGHRVVGVITIPESQIQIPNHTHGIVYGIYSGATAHNATIVVDGNEVPISESDNDEMDIVPYLEKDDNGKITRGRWHEIEIVPDGLSRIEANLFVQTFVTSYSGGNY